MPADIFHLSTQDWILVLIAALIVGFAKTGIAGVGILAPVMMAGIFPARYSIGILLPMLIMADAMAVLYYRRHAQWKHVLKALPLGYLGIVCGFIILLIFGESHGFDAYLKKIIGIIVLVILGISSYQAYHKKKHDSDETKIDEAYAPPWWFAPFLGIVGGIATMLANAAGPIFYCLCAGPGLTQKQFHRYPGLDILYSKLVENSLYHLSRLYHDGFPDI